MFSNIFERCRFTGNLTSTDGMNNPWIEIEARHQTGTVHTESYRDSGSYVCFLNRLNIKQLRSRNGPSLIAAIQELYGVVIHN